MVRPAEAAALALQLAQLDGLQRWAPAAALAERAVDALRGDGPWTPSDAALLRRWAAAWGRAGMEGRAFWRLALQGDLDPLDEDAVQAGLAWVLGSDREPTGPQRGRLRRLFANTTGVDGDPTCRRTT